MKPRTLLAVCAVALLSATFALADEWNHKTIVTFSQPVAIPAVHQPGWGVLPPGTYVFKLLDSASNRHIVQIYNKDENEIYATILAIPNMRMRVTDKPVITFRETVAGEPAAIRAMFYPGANWGEEFVYPKTKALQIAKTVKEPVLSMPVENEEARPEAPAVILQLKEAPLTAIEPSGNEVAQVEVVTPPAEIAKAEPAPALPQTASPLPLLALMGLLIAGTGVTLRFAERRIR